MECPFYLVIACLNPEGGRTFHLFYEVDGREVDVDDKEVLYAHLVATKWHGREEKLVSLIVIRNSLEGAPSYVECWE